MIVSILKSHSTISERKIDAWTGNIALDYSMAKSMLGWEPRIRIQDGLIGILKIIQLNEDHE